ncbi:MAG TPA: zinc ribbon domain-containing protein [Candidatus Onthocola stercorigallinarum]|nr:zinc ribbon domain-containing protein [Candidatus Onthocola stercorigallinarum]
MYCVACGEKLDQTCSKCNHIIKKKDKYCANCGRKN